MKRNIPTYEEFIDHKKLTAKQHAKKREQYRERYFHNNDVEQPKDRVGVCDKCKKGSFTLEVNQGVMTRICKTCGDVIVV